MIINDKAECVFIEPLKNNSIAPELMLKNEYTILNLYVCGCGEIHVDVGLVMDINYVECYKCRETLPSDIRWCNSIRFNIKK